MKMCKGFVVLLAAGVIAAGCGKEPEAPPQVSAKPVESAESRSGGHVAKGAILKVILQTAISSDKSREGDPIKGILAEDVSAGDKIVLKKGTEFYGEILEAVPATESKDKSGHLSFVFNEVETSKGRKPALMSVMSAEMDESKADQTARMRTQFASTAVGAILGRQVAKNNDKSKGGGLAVGAAAGLAVGTLISKQQGVDVEMGQGARVKLRVDDEF